MIIDESKEKKIIENNRKISNLLKENELLIKSEGFDPPSYNYTVDYCDRINIPSGYIRTSQQFIDNYYLKEIVKDNNTRNNIAYSLQLSDYYNYLVNRFNLWGSVRTMFYKYDIINLMAILESLITEAMINTYLICNKCKKQRNCSVRLNRSDQNSLKKSIDHLYKTKLLSLTQNEVKRIKEIYDLRNRVHIRESNNNEFVEDSFSQNTHNELIMLLRKVSEQINQNLVPKYDNCESIKPKRMKR